MDRLVNLAEFYHDYVVNINDLAANDSRPILPIACMYMFSFRLGLDLKAFFFSCGI